MAHATGPRDDGLVARAIQQASGRAAGQPVRWTSDGWQGYPTLITHTYRQPVHTGRPGRPRLVVPAGVSLTQTIKQRDRRGRVVGITTRATIGEAVPQPVPVHVERLNGVLRDRLAALTRKTHAFAKTTRTWDALLGVAIFEHNWLRPHPALRQPSDQPGRRYLRRTPAMAIGLTDHVWSWTEFLSMPVPITT